jgi:predicted Zn-dependent peptidase
MNYKKYTTNAYNIHLINTDKFKTITVRINFKKLVEKKDITYRNLLLKVLFQANENYKSKRELEIITEDLYNLSIASKNSLSGNYIVTSIDSIFLNEKFTEDGMNNKSINFLLDLIFKPLIKNKEFEYFDLAKRLVSEEIKTFKDDLDRYSKQRLLECMDKVSPLSYNPVGYIEDLENITSKDLYKYYEKMIKSDLIDIFIIGDITEDIIDTIKTNFKVNTLKKPGTTHYFEHKKLRKEKKYIEQMDVSQSKLKLGIKLNNLTDFERKYVAIIYSYILGGGPDSKLFKNVREKNSLCYTINCSYMPVYNLMMIQAGINKEDFKKCLSLIKKEIKEMVNGNFESRDIQSAKVTYLSSLKEIEDSQGSIIRIFESHEYLNLDLLDERVDIMNVTKEDIVNFAKKINIDTIYLLEGVIDEEN